MSIAALEAVAQDLEAATRQLRDRLRTLAEALDAGAEVYASDATDLVEDFLLQLGGN